MRNFPDEPNPDVKGLHVAKRPEEAAPLNPIDIITHFK